ncbi:hexokinase type 1-like [Drosophila hydei]|uniref:Phosphotransferase n=1 Tax=Drosophila hydei TaxID=7224 RepID=A0A6J2SQT6_DROHY|nr:hexokinase type 1-like [Drosophila hydei]
MQKYDPEKNFPEAWKLLKPFMLSDETLVTIRNSMSRELLKGLARDTHERSSVPCLLSYVQQLPTGHERGHFLALEMWPTNCRIMLVKFNSEKDIYMSSKCVIVPHKIAASRSTTFFNFLAYNIAVFVRNKKVEKDNLPMGIAFAFELNKLALDVGILIRWAPGYGVQSAVGKNVVQLLRNALNEFTDIRINLNSIVDISIGSLMAINWSNPHCKMAIIVGLLTKSAYVEQLEACEMYEGDRNHPFMIINTNWGKFGSNGHLDIIRNEFDKLIDANSNNPGMMYYEKCISTVNISELVRLIVVRLMKMGVLFKDASMDKIGISWNMEMKSIVAVESDPPNVYTAAQKAMDKFGINNCTEQDLATFRFICATVSLRSAQLVAVGVACLIDRMSYTNISIAVEDSNSSTQKIVQEWVLLS